MLRFFGGEGVGGGSLTMQLVDLLIARTIVVGPLDLVLVIGIVSKPWREPR